MNARMIYLTTDIFVFEIRCRGGDAGVSLGKLGFPE